jgi:hypothetical protein
VTVMLTGLPRVSWRRFFRHLTTQGQRELERALADCGLLLGEYMELVERAYLEAYVLREASPGRERVDLDVTSQGRCQWRRTLPIAPGRRRRCGLGCRHRTSGA